ncbi:MAG: zinc ribbon domain-containing protein [Pseudomonadota bacterium]|nr:zinc ribbon domain-containing protein [Pseudomonadota bacterium]
MPIYDYQCGRCGLRFEQVVKLGETPACPSCGDAGPERLATFSATVSTEKTRKRSFSIARGRAQAEKKEKDHAHREYLQNHIREHGGGED